MPFNPQTEYTIISSEIGIKDFHDYGTEYITRPPYQRKSVWSRGKKQSLMDSLFRRYYVPKLVIREVRLSKDDVINEVIDGQQRITTVQEFFANKYPLPDSLANVHKGLAGAYYKDLDTDIRRFIDKNLKYQADIIKNIEDRTSEEHRITATEIFWRLQQGESLNYMEVAHAQLSSLTRNFIVKYADDQTFDYDKYEAVDNNPDKEPFFSLLNFDNMRMRHLQLMARFTMIECGGGYASLSDRKVEAFIDDARQTDDGIGNFSFEKKPAAKATLKTLRVFYDIFKDDTMLDSNPNSKIKELSREYFIISIYVLIRHLNIHYVIDEKIKIVIRDFLYDFHGRWKDAEKTDDSELLTFSTNSQQGEKELETRDSILRHFFFMYLKKHNKKITPKDSKRAFSELERIKIYRKGKGLCQQCIRDKKPYKATVVSWSKYQADHVIPHSKGGQTVLENAELLCQTCNLAKGAS